MPNPPALSATYRLQFNSDFKFSDATALVDYLANLGISDVYASPILSSRKGSKHGYDVTDVSQINPEIGSVEDFEQLQSKLLERGMRLILDIVPNHMAASSENRWWMDILENGPESAFASYFDVDWKPLARSLDGKVLLPVLGRPFGEVLDRGELRLVFEGGKFYVRYFESIFPLTPRSYRRLLKHRVEEVKATLSEESSAYQEYSGIIAALSPPAEASRAELESHKRGRLDAIRERLQRLVAGSPDIASFIDRNIADFNGSPGDAASFCSLEHLLGDQHFLLAYWQDPNEGINYRRFFAISELVGVRVEDPLVFEATHDQILRLASKPVIRGVRVDHIDGLRDPAGYLNKLQERLAASQTQAQTQKPDRPYVVVEKILSRNECLPEDWPISGTTGYEYLNAANSLFVSPSGAKEIETGYFNFIGTKVKFANVMYEKKKLVMNGLLRVEMRSLGRQLSSLASNDRYAKNLLRPELTDALLETTACLTVYRTYIRNLDVPESAKALIVQAIDEARKRRPHLGRGCFDFLQDVLTLANPPHILADQREERLAFVMRWQQFTGPIVAKGIEDTALYVYYPLLSLNEVGGSPEPSKLMSWEAFSEFILDRQKHWPETLNAASTHDTKRSEGVRARINVLSEIPDDWSTAIATWAGENESHKRTVGDCNVPDANEEYLIYQTLVGMWPTDPAELPSISKRLQDYAIKATREASVHTQWTEPNAGHEHAICTFIEGILSPEHNAGFLNSVARFVEKVAYPGMVNSLGQTLLKVACPGVPDFYQGTELWDFHLVDPDNRDCVDFGLRTQALQALMNHGGAAGSLDLANELLAHWPDGRIKLYLIWKALSCRRDNASLFTNGEFIPLRCTGPRSQHVISFLRKQGNDRALVLIPRWISESGRSGNPPDATQHYEFWKDTNLHLPPSPPAAWRNIFTGETVSGLQAGGTQPISVGALLKHFPVALIASTGDSPI